MAAKKKTLAQLSREIATLRWELLADKRQKLLTQIEQKVDFMDKMDPASPYGNKREYVTAEKTLKKLLSAFYAIERTGPDYLDWCKRNRVKPRTS